MSILLKLIYKSHSNQREDENFLVPEMVFKFIWKKKCKKAKEKLKKNGKGIIYLSRFKTYCKTYCIVSA